MRIPSIGFFHEAYNVISFMLLHSLLLLVGGAAAADNDDRSSKRVCHYTPPSAVMRRLNKEEKEDGFVTWQNGFAAGWQYWMMMALINIRFPSFIHHKIV